jgi:hypothetical protein
MMKTNHGFDYAFNAQAVGGEKNQVVLAEVTEEASEVNQLVPMTEKTEEYLAGADDPSLVARDVTIRSDSAGCIEGFLAACRARNVGFAVVARRDAQVEAAIFDAIGHLCQQRLIAVRTVENSRGTAS